jgi:hypothetical protein
MSETLELWQVVKLFQEQGITEFDHPLFEEIVYIKLVCGCPQFHDGLGDIIFYSGDGDQINAPFNGYTVHKKKVKAWLWECKIPGDFSGEVKLYKLITDDHLTSAPNDWVNVTKWRKVEGSEIEVEVDESAEPY